MILGKGFTLIEVLVAMLVLAVGLLSLSALQVQSLKYNQTAYNRNQAINLAYDLADRMRSNGSANASYITSHLAVLAATCGVGVTSCTHCTDVTHRCSPNQLALKDLYEWNNLLIGQLPRGPGTITLNGLVYTITVSWDDTQSGVLNNQNTAFAMSFQ